MSARRVATTDLSRSAILAHLGAHGPTSRAVLARALSLSPATITQLTKTLLGEGLVVEIGQTPSQGGRPGVELGLAASAGHAIGVKIVADHIAFVEVALDGRVLRSASEPFDPTAATFLGDLTALLHRFIANAGSERVLGVGVGVPGSVDDQASGLVDSWPLAWSRVPLGEHLRRELDLPVLVENNVNALAVAERLYGLGRRHEDFIAVTIGTGIGAAVVVDGALVRGASGGAGELGHLPLVEDGPPCSCGNRGCLEALIGEAALVDDARAAGVIGPGAGIAALQEAADRQSPDATGIFEAAGHRLGRALAGMVQLLDPEAVIVLGEGTAAWTHWSFGFEPAFRSTLLAGRRGLPVLVETWQDESWAQGAAALVLATPFDSKGVAGSEGELVRARLSDGSRRDGVG